MTLLEYIIQPILRLQEHISPLFSLVQVLTAVRITEYGPGLRSMDPDFSQSDLRISTTILIFKC